MNYQNPVIPGFYPDPSVCRVGGDYYLVTSSFLYCPGIPVFHSRDLVNWELIGHCLEGTNFPDLSEVEESGGVWAPTIRYDSASGLFYVTASIKEKGRDNYSNVILHAAKPEGPWSEPVRVNVGGIDPSLLFDEGKAWYCTNDWKMFGHAAIVLGAVDPDTGETLEPFREIWTGTGEGWLEAPHIYRIGDWYYLLCAEGGTYHGHMASIARSREIAGPYEACPHNPVLTARTDTSKQTSCCGHGDLFCDDKGNWWMVHLGCRPGLTEVSPLGRETFLTPVNWADGWPKVKDGRARLLEEGPVFGQQKPQKAFSDDFSGADWPGEWCFIRGERKNFSRGQGVLSIVPQAGDPQEYSVKSFACVRQPDLVFSAEALVVVPEEEGTSAGLMVYQNWNQFMFFALRNKGEAAELFLRRVVDDLNVETFTRELPVKPGEPVRLKVKADREAYRFILDLKGEETCATASARFMASGLAGRGFTGAMAGVFTRADKDGPVPVRIRSFSCAAGDVQNFLP